MDDEVIVILICVVIILIGMVSLWIVGVGVGVLLPFEVVVLVDHHGVGGNVNVEIAMVIRGIGVDNPGDVINLLLFAVGTSSGIILPEPGVDAIQVETVFTLKVYLFLTKYL